jgi:hypothetical protein
MTAAADASGNMSSSESKKKAKKGSLHEEFKESTEVKGIIENLPSIYNDQIAVELALERFLCKWCLYGLQAV